jgi:hypothetical protein
MAENSIKHFLMVLMLTCLLGGCISTDGPIIDPDRSVAPAELVGLWSTDKKGEFHLIEAMNDRQLRYTIYSDQKIHLHGLIHTARLHQNMFVLEHVYGIEIVHLDGRNGLVMIDFVPVTSKEYTESVAKKYKIAIELSRPDKTSPRLKIDGLGGANHERLIAFLNELIDRSLLMPSEKGLQRDPDKQAFIKAQDLVEKESQKREAEFISALSLLSSTNREVRYTACHQMNRLSLRGHLEGTTQWGRCRLYGWYLEADPKIAFAVLDRAYWFGSKDAGYEFGKAYIEGTGKKVDRMYGESLLKRVAEQGHAGAKAYLENLAKKDAKYHKDLQLQTKKDQEREEARKSPWRYESENKSGVMTARTASATSANGAGKLFVRVDLSGRVGVFYKPDNVDLDGCEKRCTLSILYIEKSKTEIAGFSMVASEASKGWYEIKETMLIFNLLERVTSLQLSPDTEENLALDYYDEFISGALDKARMGVR